MKEPTWHDGDTVLPLSQAPNAALRMIIDGDGVILLSGDDGECDPSFDRAYAARLLRERLGSL